MEASRETSHCWTCPQAWADDNYERRASAKGRASILYKEHYQSHGLWDHITSGDSEETFRVHLGKSIRTQDIQLYD